MGIETNFSGKTIFEPGVYGQTKSKIKNPPLNLDFGTVLLIDTGLGAGYGGNSINGALTNGIKAVQTFSDIEEMQTALGGGIFSALAQPLFQPNGFGFPGASKVKFISARTSTAAELTLTLTNFSIVIQTKQEGLAGNGVLSTLTSRLLKGFGLQLKKGDTYTLTNKNWKIEFTRGSFAGLDANGDPYFGEIEANSKPNTLLNTDDISTGTELKTFLENNAVFNQYFKIKTFTITDPEVGDDIIDADLTANGTLKLAIGGTETYAVEDVDALLEQIIELDYNVILSDNYGVNTNGGGKSATNTKYLGHLLQDSKYGRILAIPGGNDVNSFNTSTGSTGIAQYFDNQRVFVVHGSYIKVTNAGERVYDALYQTAKVVGRIFGLAPQIPGTFKSIDVDGQVHILSVKERKIAIKSGVLHMKVDENNNDVYINQSINSLQKNSVLVNPDGTSFEISVVRVNDQVLKFLMVSAFQDFAKSEDGVNRGSLTQNSAIEWTKGKLLLITVRPGEDGLILGSEQFTASIVQDAIFVNFGYGPNFPVNKILFTAFQLDLNL